MQVCVFFFLVGFPVHFQVSTLVCNPQKPHNCFWNNSHIASASRQLIAKAHPGALCVTSTTMLKIVPHYDTASYFSSAISMLLRQLLLGFVCYLPSLSLPRPSSHCFPAALFLFMLSLSPSHLLGDCNKYSQLTNAASRCSPRFSVMLFA